MNDVNMDNIGKKIQKLRKKHGDTLEELGEKLHFNYSNLSKIERGLRHPTLELINGVSQLYGVPLVHFFEDGKINVEFQEMGADWVAFVEEMKEKQITPDELRTYLNVITKLQN